MEQKMWVVKEVAQSRFDICKQCDRLIPVVSMCKECGCAMKIKVKMTNSVCPLGKWGVWSSK